MVESMNLRSVWWVLFGFWCTDWTWVWLVCPPLCLYGVCCWCADEQKVTQMWWADRHSSQIVWQRLMLCNFSDQIKTPFSLQIFEWIKQNQNSLLFFFWAKQLINQWNSTLWVSLTIDSYHTFFFNSLFYNFLPNNHKILNIINKNTLFI